MTTLAIHIAASSVSAALADEWGGISPLLPELAGARDSYAVAKVFTQQAAQGCVAANAEAMAMAATAGSPPARFSTWCDADAAQLGAPVLAAAATELARKRTQVDRVLMATATDPWDPDVAAQVLAVRTAGWPAPLRIPRAMCIAAAYAASDADRTPIAVVEICAGAVFVSELMPDAGLPVCRVLSIHEGAGPGALWKEAVDSLVQRFAGSSATPDQIRCEAQRFARALLERALQPGRDTSLSRVAFTAEGAHIEQHALAPWTARMRQWMNAVLEAVKPQLAEYASAVVWVEDLGIAGLAQKMAAALQECSTCRWRAGSDPAQGAARLGATGIDLATISRLYAKAPDFGGCQYGVLRPNGAGGTEFRALGGLGELATPQKLALKTTREDQARIVLPIAIQREGHPAVTLGILEFALSAPAKKGVQVEFHIELDDPLLRIRGVAGQNNAPVGEAFVPLDGALAEAAAAYRAYVRALGPVI